ncbi:hypothetical protein HJC23_012051 [Cyclotella cryptica]|uniref:Adenylate cyclase n=1 Tax=Cyclotella cryptica TaxID=29204 RepID=A0ABD3PQS9_9STRA|eukprot:CCRYP_012358-RB/>CCRYP_012358-RB protein AED:0.09 eAED:0.06 QI:0/1/0.85/1/0.66/0.85/7/207/906
MVSLAVPDGPNDRLQLLEAKAKYLSALNDAILRASGQSLIVVDQAGFICWLSEDIPNIFGYEQADGLINQNVDIIVQDLSSSLYLGDYSQREARGVHTDGCFLQLEVGIAPIRSATNGRNFAITIKHITRLKKKRLSSVLRESAAYILDAAFDPMFCTDGEGSIIMVNQAAVNEFGWSQKEFIGQNVRIIVGGDHQDRHDSYMQHYIETGEKKMIGKKREIQARRKDGTEFIAELGLAEIPQKHFDEHIFCGFIRNLTKEKGAQAEIVAKQNLTSKIIEASFDALFVINQHGIIQMVNEQSTKALGWSREEFIGQNINMIMPVEHAEYHDSYLARYLKTGMKNMMETEREVEARRKDGSMFPCILGLAQVDQHVGSDRLFCGFIRSLAREKALERRVTDEEQQNLKNSQEILEQRSTILGILDASFHALFVITEDERIIQMVNQKSCDVFGWTREEFIGQNISMIMTDDVASHHDQYVENYLATGVKKMIGKQREVTAKRKDGSTFPAALDLAEPQAAGLICGFIRDLTQEKAAQADIIREQLLTSKIIDASFDALFVINDGGIIQQVNKASCNVFGWSREEFVGQNITMIMRDNHADKHDTYLSRFLQSRVKKMIGTEREIEARRRDGSTFPCILGLSEVVTNGTTQFVGFVRDVTIRKLLAEAEREASDSLLFNILPEHIACRLKADPSHIADHYDNTTILFADIVGFTDKTSKMSPRDVVSMLNDIFSRFDHLCDIYELNKVKTIGDCYMITSIPSNILEHDGCARVCRFALAMLRAVRDFNDTFPQYGSIDFRVGISTGPVVAGVVGIKRLLFDMWGDTVNVAARMEQSGLAGQIQVTRHVVDNAGSDFTFESRGTLMVKGKGLMDVYILKSAKPNEKWRHSMKGSEGPKLQQTLRCKSTLI